MKVSTPSSPIGDVHLLAAALPTTHGAAEEQVREQSPPSSRGFIAIYDRWYSEVSRWVRALGGPEADNEDLVQEVFIIVERRLSSFRGDNIAGWLYRIASRQVRDYRRRRWFTRVMLGRNATPIEVLPDHAHTPSQALELKDTRRLLHGILDKMNEERRAAFVLFEIEGYSGQEIAQIQQVPLSTVWTRLHHARKEFNALLEKNPQARARNRS